MFRSVSLLVTVILRELIVLMPDELTRFRVAYYRKKGYDFAKNVSISTNVRFRGCVSIGENSSIAQNCTISSIGAPIIIGDDVMIAPNVVIVSFDHRMAHLDQPMRSQGFDSRPVLIGNDVWIGANVTISKGVEIGEGAVIGANSVVTKLVRPYTICAGCPAVVIGERKNAR